MNIKNNLKKFLVILVLVLLIIPIVIVNANAESIGDTEATIIGNNYEIKNESNQIILSSGSKVELTGNAGKYKIVVEENAVNVSIILNNYTANAIDEGWNSSNVIELKDGSSATITLIGENNLSAGRESSAIRVPINTSLVIDGEGTLNASVNNMNAGASSAVIGSSYNNPFGNITINSGNIYTKFTGGGANTGIGSGFWTYSVEMSGTIAINGGNIHTEVLGSLTDSEKVSLKGNGSAIVYSDNLQLKYDEFNGIIFDSNGKEGTVKGNVTLNQNIDIPSGSVLTVEENATLNIPTNVTITNNGIIKNDGTIINTGNLQNIGQIQSTGTISSSTEIDNVTGNEVEIIFYDVIVNVGQGGTIKPDQAFKIKYGESATFDILPDEGYKIKSIKVNDIDKTNELVDNKLTLSNITENIIIGVEFEKLPDTSEDTILDTYYDISIKFGNGGAISPNQSFKIKHGESATFNILPDEGYKIKSIIVNEIDKTNDVIDGKLTLSNITENITITAEFEKLADISKENIVDNVNIEKTENKDNIEKTEKSDDMEKIETYDNIVFYVVIELICLIIIMVKIYFKRYKNSKIK